MSSQVIAPHVQAFFTESLVQQRRLSPQTLLSCRDTFRLWLTFLRHHTGVEPAALRMADVDAPVVLRFLDYLEQERRNSVRSRNIRLAALRAFFRFVALRDPASLGIVTRVLAIPVKRTDQKLIGYLTRPEIQALLTAPDRATWVGRRNHALLVTLYKSGARVSEITTLKQGQIHVAEPTCVQLVGKGRKERTIPLWADTARMLRGWFQELGEDAAHVAFPSARGTPLSRDGVDDLLKQTVQRAVAACPSLATTSISPHVIRHTTAMHLLQAGVDMATMALWLGHERLETTHRYLQADLAMKEKALEKLEPIEGEWKRFHADDPLLAFLAAL
jgi:integrase/recombinase XerD